MGFNKQGVSRLALAVALTALATSPAFSAPATPDEPTTVEGVVVTGYRASLASALAVKRSSNSIVEVIDAEDIADFPDLNLAESLQRVPGVAIDRDGGEGRSITVRGLSPDFTRVRINGLEALATTGGKDLGGGGGGANRGRGFDFQVFASELFNRVTVRKSQAAETEEGSLGATVDLRAALPFDYPGRTAAGGVQYGYNDLSRSIDPRATALLSDTWLEGRLGALVSIAYGAREVLEEGPGTGRWENPSVPTNAGGCFRSPGPCNTPLGTYSAVNAAWHARTPRYARLQYEWERLGATAALQFRPDDQTLITLTGLYAKVGGERHEDYLETYLTRPVQGVDHIDVSNAVIDSKNQLISATFNNVDVRTESRYDELSSTFNQVSLDIERRFGERLKLTAAYGDARSIQDNPVQTTVTFEAFDTPNYGYDFSPDQNLPALTYGFDVTSPASWVFSSSKAKGEPSLLRMRPNKTTNRLRSGRLDGDFTINDALTLKAGVLGKQYDFATSERRRFTANGTSDLAVALPAGVSLADVSRLVDPIGRNLGMPAGTPRTWLAPDVEKISALLDLNCDCVNAYGDFRVSIDNQRAGNRDVSEKDVSGYLQLDFDTMVLDMRLRGDVGVRYARTDMTAGGFVQSSYVTLSHTYEDILPALNLVLEPRDDLLVRFSAAKVMSRPQLPYLTPGGTISNTARSITIGNPDLDPIRATTFDLNLEWYPGAETILSVGLFLKDLRSYIQSSSVTLPYSATGFPDALLTNNNTPATLFQIATLENTAGGELKGYEVSLQKPFGFLPAPFDRLGAIANYTYAQSEISYITDAAATPQAVTVMPLVGLSPHSWNATLYYEGDALSGRVSAAYRDSHIGSVPGGNGNDARGKAESLTVDAAATLKVSKRATLTLEALNLTDVFDERWISRERLSMEEYTHTGRQLYVGVRYRF